MGDYIIETKELTKRYGNHTCIDRLCLHVPKGKIYGLLGRNGAGKTTTMKMLLNLTQPTSGNIYLFGEDCQNCSQKIYQRIGSLIETPSFYENLTGSENLEILARMRGSFDKEQITHALRMVNLEEDKKKIFAKYSLGMKQRLGIAAAIMHKPEILILDEPTNALDPIGIQGIRNYMLQLCKEYGTTILLSSHVLSEIEHIADIIGVMHDGSLLEEISMEELHKQTRRYAEFKVSDADKAYFILKNQMQITDMAIENEHIIRIYGDDIGRCATINQCLNQNDILVARIVVCEADLENYFSGLIGGGSIG